MEKLQLGSTRSSLRRLILLSYENVPNSTCAKGAKLDSTTGEDAFRIMKHQAVKITVKRVCRGCYYAMQSDGDMGHGHGRTAVAALADFLQKHRIAQVTSPGVPNAEAERP